MNKRAKTNLLAQDLDHILEHTKGLWEDLREKKVFVTGGTGFFGKWLLESFVWANNRLKLNAQMHVLSRNPDAFRKKYPRLGNAEGIVFHQGDVRTFDFLEERIDSVIHAATDASAQLNQENPLLMMDTIIEGTRRVLEFSQTCGAKRFLLTSSGAVYGKLPSDMTHVSEDYCSAPDPTRLSSAYGEGKRAAELLCALYSKKYGFETKIARCFAFVGPYLSLDIHYAIGNFIRDGLNGDPIRVNGDGTPYRSYLYAADLAIWLWTILFRGESGLPYNVGSEDAFTIAELAQLVADYFDRKLPVIIEKQSDHNKQPERYVPRTVRPREELELKQFINLKESIKKTINWHYAQLI